ncbi:hypothetical protein PHLCEN_2v12393 [Hermanssonia centrifuga]|uniref:Uncharacterized protein n=1 Tax=Hermanssonia centrifuga TaxID=98765 RepID=A0A2R6NH82_9APHY|nr:hypothetical protein PHLCEN_2v12393 [Hermanssonia centrifuga]
MVASDGTIQQVTCKGQWLLRLVQRLLGFQGNRKPVLEEILAETASEKQASCSCMLVGEEDSKAIDSGIGCEDFWE